MEKQIKTSVKEGVSKLYHTDIKESAILIQNTKKEFKGDFTLVVFPLLKISKKGPEETATELGNYLQKELNHISGYNVIQGFLNLELQDSFWVTFLSSLKGKPITELSKQKGMGTIMVEYSQPNTNKPLHLGHLRNNILGYSLANILKANGNEVIKANIINDRGIHICKSMLAWHKWGNGETPQSTKMKGDKLVGKYYVEFDKHYKEEIAELESEGISKAEASKKAPLIIEAQEMLRKWESGDAETVKLWRTMNDWVLKGFDITYKEFGVDFDKIYYESETYLLGREIVMDGINKGYFYKKEDASVWCDLDNSKLDHKLVLRSDGTSVYITQDIGTATQRFSDYSLDQLIYVVGDEQNHHFKVLFEILKKMGFSWAANCHHLSYGMVELPSGKMKSREGTVVDADDLMENMAIIAQQLSEELGKMEGLDSKEKQELYRIIGLGALKYFLIKVDPKKKMMFNPEESIDFNGNTGPFIQYTYARIQSLVRKQQQNMDSIELVTPKELAIQEKQLIKHMYQFPAIIHEAANALSPALVANYVYEVAKSFNHYYQALPILKADQQEVVNFRVHLSKTTGELIKTCMNLLGIEMPDRM